MKQYEMFELQLTGPEPEGSRAAVDVNAVFEKGGTSIPVKGFYKGDGIYAVRFYPAETGAWHYTVSGVVSGSGELICEPAGEGARGMVHADSTHFRYADGTWYYPVGTTVYALSHQEESLVEQTFKTLASAPFNKIRICVFPKSTEYNRNEPPVHSARGGDPDADSAFALEKTDGQWDVHRPNLAFWNKLETDIVRLGELGYQCDLILLHPYDRWGLANMPHDDMLVYLDYVTRRLAAFPHIWWSMANEYDVLDYSDEDWRDFMRCVKAGDPYGHLLSIHMMANPWDFSEPEVTHVCLQTGNVGGVSEQLEKYHKPVMIDETGYEGNIEFNWGNLTPFEMVNRFWTVCVQGGYCTHGETYWDPDEILWWGKGGVLHGESPARIGFLRQVLESLPGPITSATKVTTREQFEMMKQVMPEEQRKIPLIRLLLRADWEHASELLTKNQELMGCCGEDAYLKYYARRCTCKGEIDLPENGSYDIDVIDVWEMTRTRVLEKVSGKTPVPLPGKKGIAVLATRRTL